ncbi:SMP-30/gluconolactonase/LRE family protein [Devosia sp. A369]
MNKNFLLAAGVALGVSAGLISQALAQDITIAADVFPENIASAADGSLLISSITQGIVYRVAPGATSAEPWITDIGPAVTGVFAHENNVYVCSNGPFGANEPGFFKVYDLANGEETASYDFPAGGLCSDAAAAPDGTIYVTQLGAAPGRLFQLTATGLEEVLVDDAIAGLDGLAFIGETLYANNLQTGELYRINLEAGPVSFTPLTLSQPLERPDGMRTAKDGQSLLIAEAQGNRVVQVTIDGDLAKVTEIAGDLDGGPTGVAQIGDTVYVVEGHFYGLNPDAERTPPEMFTVRQFPLP